MDEVCELTAVEWACIVEDSDDRFDIDRGGA
jgi:hypothetical protein